MTSSPEITAAPAASKAINWVIFSLVCASYVASTIGEQVLGPIFPESTAEFGLTEADGGIAFGVLAISIAIMNLGGGWLLRRFRAQRLIMVALVVSACGSAIAANAQSFAMLVLAQALLGAGAGLFFPSGLQTAGIAAGPAKRGFAMGMYGVAYSLGLTGAAVLGSLGASIGWRWAFGVSCALSIAAAVGTLFMRTPHVAPEGGGWSSVKRATSLPTAVGAAGAMCQYGTIAFLTTYAVQEWKLSAADAAAMLAVGRVLSIVAKVISGASSDRVGPHASARSTGLVLVATGLGWVLLPGGLFTYALAAIFAGAVSSTGPIANMLAVQRFGRDGMALGAFRSAQIALGALAGAAIGFAGDALNLKVVLAFAVLIPLSLVWMCRPSVAARDVSFTRAG